MSTENKKKSLSEDSPKKMDYIIQTMDTDLKNETAKNSSFDLSSKKIPKPELKKPESIKKTKESEKRINKKESISPFLKDIGKPTPTSNYINLSDKKSEIKIQPEKKEISTKPAKNFIPKIKENDLPNISSFKKKPITPISSVPATPKNGPKKSASINNKLLIILLLISLIAGCSGAYYFYFIRTDPEPVIEPVIIPPVIQPKPETNNIPLKLKNSETLLLDLTEKTLASLLMEKQSVLPNNSGAYYQIKTENSVLSSLKLLSLLEIQFPEEALNELEEAWVFLYPLDGTLKMNLVLKIKNSKIPVESFLRNNEYHLPELLKPLFINESFVLRDGPITFLESKDLENIRYYNFIKGVFGKAIDWGILDNNFLILSTSKDATLKIMKDLKIEDISSDNLEEIIENAPLN